MNRRLIGALALSCLLMACNKLTVENYDKLETGLNYDKLETGLSYDQTVAILGKPASCDELLGIKVCRWGDDARRIIVNFVGGKIVLTSAENIH